MANGYSFNLKKDLAPIFRYRLEHKKDLFILIDAMGEKGEGKTTCAYQVGKVLEQLKYEFERNFVFIPTYENIVNKIYELPFYTPVIIDEVQKIMDKRDWASKISKMFTQFYSTNRKYYKYTIACVPDFYDLNTGFRNTFVNIRILVIARGIACIFIKNKNPSNPGDKWDTDINRKIWDEYKTKHTTPEELIKVFRKYTNFLGYFTFNAIPEKEENEYLDLCDKYKYSLAEIEEKEEHEKNAQERKYEAMSIKLIELLRKKNPKITQDEIAKELNISHELVSYYCNKNKITSTDMLAKRILGETNEEKEPNSTSN